ncbi:MAG: QueT transporter family protein, partial [Oscillospiraceae bacterium]
TIIAVIGVYKCKNIWLASIFPVVANGLIVGTELFIAFKEPSLLIQMGFVALGELVVVTIIGVPFFKLLEKNKQVMRLIKQDD